MAKLKLCPFCGGEAEIYEREESMSHCVKTKKEVPKDARILRYVESHSRGELHKYYEYREKVFIPRCLNSECAGRLAKPFKSKAKAIEAWERRANDDTRN